MLASSDCMATKSGEGSLGPARRSPAKTPMASSAALHAIAPRGERSQWNTFQFQAEARFPKPSRREADSNGPPGTLGALPPNGRETWDLAGPLGKTEA